MSPGQAWDSFAVGLALGAALGAVLVCVAAILGNWTGKRKERRSKVKALW